MTEAAERRNIMVVDDTPANLNFMHKMLQSKDYHVLTFPDGEKALNAAAKNPPDLVFLDIKMPGMDGFEVCNRLKADAALKDIPVIFISALAETKHKVKAFAAGGVDYVTKPFQFEEVNARMETHLRLRGLQLELQALNDYKNHFLGMAAHDLRTPLAAIMGFCELLANQLVPTLTDKQTKFFDMMLDSCKSMTDMINDLLDVSAIESGHININRQMVDITVPIIKSVEINRMFASPKNMSIAISCPDQLPLVFADADRIGQVIDNLLSNAIKYSRPGTDISLCLRHENDKVIVSVADKGPGIPENEQNKLFLAFGKTSVRPASEKERSTGLGLLIVKKIIEAHDGRIWFKSEPKKGTEFFFFLPSCHNWDIYCTRA